MAHDRWHLSYCLWTLGARSWPRNKSRVSIPRRIVLAGFCGNYKAELRACCSRGDRGSLHASGSARSRRQNWSAIGRFRGPGWCAVDIFVGGFRCRRIRRHVRSVDGWCRRCWSAVDLCRRIRRATCVPGDIWCCRFARSATDTGPIVECRCSCRVCFHIAGHRRRRPGAGGNLGDRPAVDARVEHIDDGVGWTSDSVALDSDGAIGVDGQSVVGLRFADPDRWVDRTCRHRPPRLARTRTSETQPERRTAGGRGGIDRWARCKLPCGGAGAKSLPGSSES